MMLGHGTALQTRVRQGSVAASSQSIRTISFAAPRIQQQSRRVAAQAGWAPPTVAQTKDRFLQNYKPPIIAIYNNVIQELLVQQHFMRYNIHYEYNAVFALGFVSVFDQVLEALEPEAKAAIFGAYLGSLDEAPEKYRTDAQQLEALASALSGPGDLTPDANGTPLQAALAKVQARAASGNFAYNKFVAIGLFRLLELTGAKEPSALEKLVKSVGVPQESVNRDLVLYKGVLSKLSAAKEMMKEFLEREKRKQAERVAEKAAKASGKVAEPVPVVAATL